MTKEPDFDVVVAGYGLAGQCAASLLSRMGYRVCVLERWTSLYGLPRVIGTDGEGLRILAKAGDIEHALKESSTMRRYEIVDAEHRLITAMEWNDVVCGFPNRPSFYQPYVEEAMDAGARSHGAQINQGWEVVGFDQAPDRVSVTARRHAGVDEEPIEDPEERTITGRYLIGADGARSTVRERLGIEWTYFDYKDAWLSVDVIRKRPLEWFRPEVVTQIVAPHRVVAAIPIGEKRMRFEFLLSGDPGDAYLSRDAGYSFIEETWGATREDVEIYRQVVYPFEGRMAREWRRGRVFLAGDAAHLMPPFVGQGAGSAFRDAINLTWKIDLVERDVVGSGLLDTYALERQPHTLEYIEIGVGLGRIVTINDPVAAQARNEVMRQGGAPPLPDPQYDVGLFQQRDGELVRPAGLREPQGVVRSGDRSGRFDDVIGWGFTLALRDLDARQLLSDEQLAFLAELRCQIVTFSRKDQDGVVVELNEDYEQFFEEHGGLIGFLSRPDFRIFAGIRAAHEVPGVVDELARQLRDAGSRGPGSGEVALAETNQTVT